MSSFIKNDSIILSQRIVRFKGGNRERASSNAFLEGSLEEGIFLKQLGQLFL